MSVIPIFIGGIIVPKFVFSSHIPAIVDVDIIADSLEEEARSQFKYYEDGHDLISDQVDGTGDIIDCIDVIKED